jgi:arginyl-tRNA synthetase
MIYSIIDELNRRLKSAINAAFGQDLSEQLDTLITTASNPQFGDYQCNIAMFLAQKLGQKPRDIAQKIISHLEVNDICQSPEIAGAGFINLTLKPEYVATQIHFLHNDSRLGIAKVKNPQNIVIDYSSPNIAKEMHVGHLRSTIIGDSLALMLEFMGHNVLRLNHLGDWGTQFGMLITYLKEAYPEALITANALNLGDLVTFYKQAKQRFDEDEDFKEASRQAVVKLQSGEPEAKKAWELLCEQSRQEFQVIYDLLNIFNLIERGESFYNPFLPALVEDLEQLGLLVEDNGAKCVFLDGFINKEGNPQPVIIQKSDGGYNYATTDLAAIKYRVNEDKAQRIIYVVDAGQSNHFAQIFQVAQRAGWLSETTEAIHVPFGLVQGENGKRLKTRSGETIKLRDLLDEAVNRAKQDLESRLSKEGRIETQEFIEHCSQIIGISAVKYADLSQNRNSNYIFSFDKMLSLQGNTAPYLLYAYVRVQGIIRKGNIDLEKLGKDVEISLSEKEEITLAKHLLRLNEVLEQVQLDLLPNRLCQYLFELSQKFNQFYESCPILSEENSLSRLILSNLTAKTLKLGLSLLGISVLERM